MIELQKTSYLDQTIRTEPLHGDAFTDEQGAHKFIITCYQHGERVNLTGTISGRFMRPGGSVALTGSVSNGQAIITLSSECYQRNGGFLLTVFNTVGSDKFVIYACTGNVRRSKSDPLIDGGEIIDSVEDLISDIQTAVSQIPVNYNASFAPAYSTTSTYAVGAYVTNNGNLYRCTTAITSGETWNSAHWTQVALANDVADLKSAIVLNGNKSVGILPCLWEQGGLFYGNGREYNSVTNIRTPFLSVVSGSPIYIAGLDTAHFALYVHEYTDTSTQSGNAKTITTSTYTPATSLVRFRLTKIPDSSQINPTEVPCVLYKLEGYVFDNTVTVYAQYNSREAWIANNPTDKLGDLPVNKIVCIGAPAVSALDMPDSSFYGNVMTVSAKNTLNPGAFQIAVRPSTNDVYIRTYKYSASGNYWTGWTKIAKDEGEVYHVGTGQTYTSLTALLVALRGNQNPKTIYIHEGEYDIFSEYLAEIENENITIPPDDITSPDYFEPYNAFVPNNTHVVGLGNVVLRFTPTVAQLESMSEESDETGYGASRTWSPLNVYGSVEIENVTVLGKNCRYCLHNDDHNDYPNSKQFYRNCRFLYTYSDADSQGRTLGFNITVGFGIDNGASQIYEGCEFYMDSALSSSAFYGHELSTAKNGTIVLKDCLIHSSNFSNTSVIRLQSLTSNGRVRTRFENCYINGGIALNMYFTTSTQNFDVTLKNCNKTPVTRSIASGGTITDPYPVTWYNPLARPTSDNPLVETDAYSSGG